MAVDGSTPSTLVAVRPDPVAIEPPPSGLRRLRARVYRDGKVLFAEPWAALRRGQWQRFWLGPASAAAVLVLTRMSRTSHGHAFLQRWAIMRGDEGWLETVEKVPLSLFAPAHLLPYRFAMLQVFVVFGGAQVLIGLRRTLLVGLAAHVLGSFSVRVWVWVGPPAGLTGGFLHLPDAGPSVAALGLVVYLVLRLRVWWLAALLLAFHLTEWVVVAGLAQREHLVGGLIGAAIAGAATALERARSRLSVQRAGAVRRAAAGSGP
jgi:hypothetical protein